jgi:hypothetical protein
MGVQQSSKKSPLFTYLTLSYLNLFIISIPTYLSLSYLSLFFLSILSVYICSDKSIHNIIYILGHQKSFFMLNQVYLC